jgi:hypothetical protein
MYSTMQEDDCEKPGKKRPTPILILLLRNSTEFEHFRTVRHSTLVYIENIIASFRCVIQVQSLGYENAFSLLFFSYFYLEVALF